jgi:hypothetical protein
MAAAPVMTAIPVCADLSDLIYTIAPQDTPFITLAKKLPRRSWHETFD